MFMNRRLTSFMDRANELQKGNDRIRNAQKVLRMCSKPYKKA